MSDVEIGSDKSCLWFLTLKRTPTDITKILRGVDRPSCCEKGGTCLSPCLALGQGTRRR